MRNTRKSGQILLPKRRPRPTLRSGKASRTNSNTSRQIPAQVIEANAGLCELDGCQRLRFCGPTGVRGAEREEHDAMREIEIHEYARQLMEAHGARAIAEAAQNAIDLEVKGEVELARTWRHIEDALKLMRGPHQS